MLEQGYGKNIYFSLHNLAACLFDVPEAEAVAAYLMRAMRIRTSHPISLLVVPQLYRSAAK